MTRDGGQSTARPTSVLTSPGLIKAGVISACSCLSLLPDVTGSKHDGASKIITVLVKDIGSISQSSQDGVVGNTLTEIESCTMSSLTETSICRTQQVPGTFSEACWLAFYRQALWKPLLISPKPRKRNNRNLRRNYLK